MPERIQRMMWPRPRHGLLAALHLLKQPFRALPGEAEPGPPLVRSAPLSQCLSSLLARAAMPEDLEAIRLTCLKKEIDLELSHEKWQVSWLGEPWVSTLAGASRRTARGGVHEYDG